VEGTVRYWPQVEFAFVGRVFDFIDTRSFGTCLSKGSMLFLSY
jgi:hypothetical protein